MKREVKYCVKSVHSEKKNNEHTIIETWKCGSIRSVKKALTDALDLTCDDKHMPIEPDETKIRNDLTQYASEKDIVGEIARQKRAWKAYQAVIEKLNAGEDCAVAKVDCRTTIHVYVMTGEN